MPAYRVILKLRSSLGTPLISGTIWGHLAWTIRYLEGKEALENWIEKQRDCPWLISSATPAGYVPRPLLRPVTPRLDRSSLNEMHQEKQASRVSYIRESVFIQLREAMSERALRDLLIASHEEDEGLSYQADATLRAHNKIDRVTGKTPETGGLYFEDIISHKIGSRWQIFVVTPNPSKGYLEELFTFIGRNGFGANASTGNGIFDVHIEEEKELFEKAGNRAMSLSHGIITSNMRDPRYKQHVHFGKLGGHYAKGSYSPFKYPILMAKPGATFAPDGVGPFGAILNGVHHDPGLSHIYHYAIHLPLFYTEVAS